MDVSEQLGALSELKRSVARQGDMSSISAWILEQDCQIYSLFLLHLQDSYS